MLLTQIDNYKDEEVLNIIKSDIKKASIVLEFLSLINWCLVPVYKLERKNNYEKLIKMLDLYYKKYKVNLIYKIKNKKFLDDLFKEVITEKIETKEIKEPICFFEDIPTFDEFL